MVEGFCDVTGGRVWYNILAPEEENDSTPLIFIHGGPGYTHNSFRALSDLSVTRKIIFYDQLGCGKSDRPNDISLWTINRHVEELNQLVSHLELREFYLLGHSWGSIIALEYANTHHDLVKGIIFASACISVPKWIEDSKRLRRQLPTEVERSLKIGQQIGEYHSPEYLEAANEYAKRFICRLDPKPQVLLDSDAQAGAQTYLTMWGPNEFTLLGTLANYDGSEKLALLDLPVIITCGRFDEGTPEASEHYLSSLHQETSLVVFEESAHFPHVEERDKYLDFLTSFLQEMDQGLRLSKEFGKVKPTEIFALVLLLAFALLIVLYIFVN